MIETRIGFGEIVAEWRTVMRRHLRLLVLAALGLGMADTASTIFLDGKGTFALENVCNMVATFLVLRQMFRSDGLVEKEGGFGSYVSAGFLSGLGALLGLILLVVPGIYLFARWSLAPGMTIARGVSGPEALSASWRATQNSAWLIVGAYLLGFLAVIVAMAAFALPAEWLTVGGFGTLGTFTKAVSADIAAMAFAGLTVALYQLLAGGTRDLREVFA